MRQVCLFSLILKFLIVKIITLKRKEKNAYERKLQTNFEMVFIDLPFVCH